MELKKTLFWLIASSLNSSNFAIKKLLFISLFFHLKKSFFISMYYLIESCCRQRLELMRQIYNGGGEALDSPGREETLLLELTLPPRCSNPPPRLVPLSPNMCVPLSACQILCVAHNMLFYCLVLQIREIRI